METKLLTEHDPLPYELSNSEGSSNCLVICDHASNAVPKNLNQLGLTDETLRKHIGIDIGTEEIGRYLSQKLNATMIKANYSRLVIDLNRGPEHEGSILAVSDHIAIPRNQNLSPADRQHRVDEIYRPYHKKIEALLKAIRDRGQNPFIISVHSFTPIMDGFNRPWHIGLLWGGDATVPQTVIQNLRAHNPDFVIGDNEPYSIQEDKRYNNTIEVHAEGNNIPSIIPEFRQDMVSTPKDALKMAQIFLASLEPVINDPKIYK